MKKRTIPCLGLEGLDFVRIMVSCMRGYEPVLIRQLERADQVSREAGQVPHGLPHAREVCSLGLSAGYRIEHLFPGTLFEEDLLVFEASGLTHDGARAYGVVDHHKAGGKWVRKYLLGLAKRLFGSSEICPKWFLNRVVECVRLHGSESWLGHRKLSDKAMALLLPSDKFAGSEARLAPEIVEVLRRMESIQIPTWLRKKHNLSPKWTPAWVNWNDPDDPAEPALLADLVQFLEGIGVVIPTITYDNHDRVNGSIVERSLRFTRDKNPDPTSVIKGSMLLDFQVKEERAPVELVYGLDWWRNALRMHGKAAKVFGLRARIRINKREIVFNKSMGCWEPVTVEPMKA